MKAASLVVQMTVHNKYPSEECCYGETSTTIRFLDLEGQFARLANRIDNAMRSAREADRRALDPQSRWPRFWYFRACRWRKTEVRLNNKARALASKVLLRHLPSQIGLMMAYSGDGRDEFRPIKNVGLVEEVRINLESAKRSYFHIHKQE